MSAKHDQISPIAAKILAQTKQLKLILAHVHFHATLKYIIYLAAKETRKLVTFKMIENIC